MACIIDSWVPTASSTECAPSPSVRSLIFCTPSSPRSLTMSVAPNSVARRWRDPWRLIAMMRSAPSCLAAMMPSRPTAPSPTTATVLPGATSAPTARSSGGSCVLSGPSAGPRGRDVEALSFGPDGGQRPGGSVDLVEDVFDVGGNRPPGHSEPVGDLRVGPAVDQQAQDLQLAG